MDAMMLVGVVMTAVLVVLITNMVLLCLHIRALQQQLAVEQKRADILDGKWRRNYLSMASLVKAANAYDAAAADALRGPPEPMPELEPDEDDQLADKEYQKQFGKNNGPMDIEKDEMV